MRLLLAMPDRRQSEEIRLRLYASWEGWEIEVCSFCSDALQLLWTREFDLMLLHEGLAGGSGNLVLEKLAAWHLPCPPRVLLMCDPDQPRSGRGDCYAPLSASPAQLCRLLIILAQKPLPILAIQDGKRLCGAIDSFLDELSMLRSLKGRHYAAWMLQHLVPSPLGEQQPLSDWYRLCAQAHGASAAGVERCLRVAVESVFTQGSMRGIERCFGEAVDPEKGKPTNRLFLQQSARLLRRRLTPSQTPAR